jgi:hypothetical protein
MWFSLRLLDRADQGLTLSKTIEMALQNGFHALWGRRTDGMARCDEHVRVQTLRSGEGRATSR